MIIKDGLTFDDVLLKPKYSTVSSRSKVDISVKMGDLSFNHPIIPANMATVTGEEMARVIVRSGGLAVLHRFMSFADQLTAAEELCLRNPYSKHFAVSIGVKNADHQNVKDFAAAGVKIICIDIAHGDSKQCVDMVEWIKENYPNMFIIAGNVATGAGAERLWRAGADAVKVGIGPGSLCTTRIETGNGAPQLTALMDVAERRGVMTSPAMIAWANSIIDGIRDPVQAITRPIYIIADGGIKSAGDCVKALCFADMVMIGNMFAGCTETPGKIMSINGHTFKEYVGSSTHKTNHIEGVAAIVPTKGSFNDVLGKLSEGLRSGCSYQGAHNLTELKDDPEFIRITNAGLKESHPHDVKVV